MLCLCGGMEWTLLWYIFLPVCPLCTTLLPLVWAVAWAGYASYFRVHFGPRRNQELVGVSAGGGWRHVRFLNRGKEGHGDWDGDDWEAAPRQRNIKQPKFDSVFCVGHLAKYLPDSVWMLSQFELYLVWNIPCWDRETSHNNAVIYSCRGCFWSHLSIFTCLLELLYFKYCT